MSFRRLRAIDAAAACLAAVFLMPAPCSAQRAVAASAAAALSEEGTRWNDLAPAQKAALKPLERDWRSHSAAAKRKWIDVAQRLPRLAPAEQSRVQARMAEWAAMTPAQRVQARLQFKEAEQVAPKGRREQWEAYQALSADRRRELARPPPRGADKPRSDHGAPDSAGQQKSNIVPNPALAARPKAVAPVVVRAAPGATTTLMSKQPSPPAHQQAGLPKIVGSPNFVDPLTLLPRRGPQGAAVTAATASAPLPRP